MFKWFRSGSPWIWLTSGAVSISLLSVLGLLLLIGWKGFAYFWAAPLYQWTTPSGDTLIGQVYQRELIPVDHIVNANTRFTESEIIDGKVARLNIKVANRELYDADFISVFESELSSAATPENLMVVERSRGGAFFGIPVRYESVSNAENFDTDLQLVRGVGFAKTIRDEIERTIDDQVDGLSWRLEKLRNDNRKAKFESGYTEQDEQNYLAQRRGLEAQVESIELRLDALRAQLELEQLVLMDMTGKQVSIPLSRIIDTWYPNNMSYWEKVKHWVKQIWAFLSEDPRESNSEGGVFPAIFGTVLLVLIMSIIVMPLGVIAAVYLHEYAKNNAFTRLIRIAVINLAGVPSIVYGVFGLGFFVYTLGGSLDDLFYADRLPAPTFGTPGLLWSALTLALLTLPVVIVTTEEGLTRIPSSVRHGSLALGATQFETIWRIVLPMASPAMITGLILAVARAAGEVAPLMLVGAVKLASSLPIDGQFPYLHLERKFMHLGFHIYDVGFQTSNIEAARPLVYATSFLLVTVIVGLNLTAISFRNNLREKYRTLGQD
ncbi:phosphate ABC transporter permease PstA [Vibrio maerlii]|uniref:phosphate ABC transporter permease PstA n=1 Tax=Vibrio maerlii TaxID=2231648 RepID=UPI000E3DE6A1|nr:phosphate ABC transporter permease PstA [Vibrio maerlii]